MTEIFIKCNICYQDLNSSEFTPNNRKPTGFLPYCKNCARIKFNIYIEKNKEKFDPENAPEGKICPTCNIYQEIDNFGNCKGGFYGKRIYCRTCTKEYNSKYRKNGADNPHRETSKKRYLFFKEKECPKCLILKDAEDFPKIRKSSEIRFSYCRACASEYNRNRYERNKKYKVDISEKRSRTEGTRIERKTIFYTWLMTQKCVDCGEDDFRTLEFDHVIGVKEFGISTKIGHWNKSLLQKEIEKCEIRCANCHKIATAKRGDYYSYVPAYDKDTYKLNK